MQPTKTIKQLIFSTLIYFTLLLIWNFIPDPHNYDAIIVIIIFLILKFLSFMSQFKEQIDAALNGIRGQVAKVGTDVTTLHDKLDAANQAGNGMTADEVADVLAQTAAISESLGAIDAKTEDAPAENTDPPA